VSLQAQSVTSALMGKLVTILSAGKPIDKSHISVVNGGYLVDSSNFDFLTDAQFSGNNPNDSGANNNNPFSTNSSDSNNPFGGGTSSTSSHHDHTHKLQHQQQMSELFNTIPLGDIWNDSGRKVNQEYDNWSRLAVVDPTQLSSDDKSELVKAKTIVKNKMPKYVKYELGYWKAVQQLVSARLSNAGLVTLKQLENEETLALQAWQTLGNKAEVEMALATVNDLQSSGYAGLLEDIKDTLKKAKSNLLVGNGWLPVNMIPDSFVEDDTAWNDFYFSSQEITKYQDTKTSSWGGSATLPLEDFFYVGGGTSGNKKTTITDINIDNLSIAFKFARVVLDRSEWFDPSLFEGRAWRLPDQTRINPNPSTIYSDGTSPSSNQGQWYLTPSEVLLIKELSISISTSHNNTRTFLENIHEHAEVGFLCFSLGGEDYNYHKNSKTHTFTSSGNTLTSKSMQIAAFICHEIPKEPNPMFDILPNN